MRSECKSRHTFHSWLDVFSALLFSVMFSAPPNNVQHDRKWKLRKHFSLFSGMILHRRRAYATIYISSRQKKSHNTKALRLWNGLREPLLRIYYFFFLSRFCNKSEAFVWRANWRKSEINTKPFGCASVKGDELLVTRADGECTTSIFFGLEISRAWWALMWLSSFYCIFAEKVRW